MPVEPASAEQPYQRWSDDDPTQNADLAQLAGKRRFAFFARPLEPCEPPPHRVEKSVGRGEGACQDETPSFGARLGRKY